MTKKRRRAVGQTIGGIVVGFDQQIFRNLPPAHELVEKAQPVRGLTGLDDGLEIVFPDDDPTAAADDQPLDDATDGE